MNRTMRMWTSAPVFVVLVFSVQAFSQEGVLEDEVRTLLATASVHPRLLMGEEAEARMRARIASGGDVQALFTLLHAAADDALEVPVLQRRQTGRRLLSVSREALRRVLLLSFVHRVTDEERYAIRAIVEMETVAAFDDWNPSHFLDVAEMTAALAIGYDWLHAHLTEEQEACIRRAIVEKGILPSMGERPLWWVRGDNNWNQVCHGGLVLGALALLSHEPELAVRVIARAIDGLPYAMKEYAPDGIYPEGPGYWEYGTSYNVVLIAALESALGTDFGITASPGFLESGAFPLLMTGPTGAHFNFSDCGARGAAFPAVFWFAQRTGDSGLAWSDYPWLKKMFDGRSAVQNRFLPLLLLWWDGHPPAPPQQPFHWKGEGVNPLATHRSSWTDPNAVFLGVKAGTPAANHGHMDVGTFILEADGVRWALDLGAEGYHKLEERGMNIWNRNQDSDRWRIYRYHNLSHNTLVVNGEGQIVRGVAPITHFSDDPEFPHTIVDMSDVYRGQLARAERGFALLPDGRVLIQDEISASDVHARVRWAMTTPAAVAVTGSGVAMLEHKERRLRMEMLSPKAVDIEVFSAEPANDWDSPNPGICQIGFYVELEPGASKTFTVLLTPGSLLDLSLKIPETPSLKDWVVSP